MFPSLRVAGRRLVPVVAVGLAGWLGICRLARWIWG